MAANRKDIRQWAANKAGPFLEIAADASGNTTVRLVDSSWPTKSSLSQDDLFKDRYLYWPAGAAADQTRIVSSYTPASGYLDPDLAWSAAPTSATVELHGLLDPDTWHDLIHAALKRLFIPIEFTVTPVANATRHSLATAASWLTNPFWVRQVGYLSTSEVRAETNPFRGRTVRGKTVQDGNVVYIDHPNRTFGTTETIYIKAIKPAYYHCTATAGNYTSTQSGFTADTHEAPVDLAWAGYAVLVEFWERYGNNISEANAAKVKVKQRDAADKFTDLTRANFQMPELTFRSLEAFGPRGRG